MLWYGENRLGRLPPGDINMVLNSVSLYSLFLTEVLFEFVFNKNAFKPLVERVADYGKSLRVTWGKNKKQTAFKQ